MFAGGIVFDGGKIELAAVCFGGAGAGDVGVSGRIHGDTPGRIVLFAGFYRKRIRNSDIPLSRRDRSVPPL